MADEAHAPPAAACDHGPLLIAEQAAKLIRKDVSRIRQLRRRIPRQGDRSSGYRCHLLDVVQGYTRPGTTSTGARKPGR